MDIVAYQTLHSRNQLTTRHMYAIRWSGLIERHHYHRTSKLKEVLATLPSDVVPSWQPPFAEGFKYFAEHIAELILTTPGVSSRHFRILRIDETKPYGPGNVFVISTHQPKLSDRERERMASNMERDRKRNHKRTQRRHAQQEARHAA